MEKLKQYVDSGQVQLATLDTDNKAQPLPYEELLQATNLRNHHAHLHRSLDHLDWDEKYQWVHLRRLKANQLYKNGNFDDAVSTYLESLVGIDLNDHRDGRTQIMQNQLKHPITMNIATCFYRKQQYKKALTICDRVLEENSKFGPALFKKTFLLIRTGEFGKAKELIEEGTKLAQESRDQKLLQDFAGLRKDLKKDVEKNKNIYEKIFNPEAEEQKKKLLPDEQEQILYYEQTEKESSWVSRTCAWLRDCLKPRIKHKRNKNFKTI